MNRSSHRGRIDWQELDRLVDGRLGKTEFCELLQQIEADPNGWKQCALAFLERQALEKELASYASDPKCKLPAGLEDIAKRQHESTAARSGFRPFGSAITGLLSMTFCVLAGLTLGSLIHAGPSSWLAPFSGQNGPGSGEIMALETEQVKDGNPLEVPIEPGCPVSDDPNPCPVRCKPGSHCRDLDNYHM